nr:hypothetical protein [Pandoravirus massiliensis]
MDESDAGMTNGNAGRAMETAEVRKGLQVLREEWNRHSPDNPICPSDRLFNGMTIEAFTHAFVLIGHKRRYNKSVVSRKAAQPSDDAR